MPYVNSNGILLWMVGLLLALTHSANAFTPPTDADEVLRVSPEMRAYFAQYVKSKDSKLDQANALIDAILDSDKFNFTYQWDGIYHAREVYKSHKGNCISFSLFVWAIFTEFGLEPTINEVYFERIHWTSLGNYIAEVGHLNVSMQEYEKTFTVDFSRIFNAEPCVNSTSPISEKRAISIFYSNYGVLAYVSRQSDALDWLKKSVEIDDNYISNSNLATVYLHEKEFVLAKQYLERAKRDRRDERLYALLASVEHGLGNEKAAAEANRKSRKYMESNPFYYYKLAEAAFNKGDIHEAQRSLNKALRMREEIVFLRLQIAINRQLQKSTVSLERRIGSLTKQ